MEKISRARNVFEHVIIAAIVLVIAQTFLDEYSRYAHWSVQARNILLITGFCFDLLFSIEFTLRTIWAKGKKNTLHYWIHERGWIDFLSSLPLLLLDSGPSVYLLFFAHLHQSPSALEVINIFKVIKAIRVTRILRLIRIVKIFGKIHNAESKMAQHHTAEISTIAVFTVISVLLGFSIFNMKSGFNLTEERVKHYTQSVAAIDSLHKKADIPSRDIASELFTKDSNILIAKYNDEVIHYKIEPDTFAKFYDAEDFSIVTAGEFKLTVSHVDLNRQIALDHIQSFFIIIALVLAFMIFYTRHFVQNITDIIHVMDKGFRKKDYNLQVHIKDEYKEHEIFKLAKFYNDNYLPAKSRRIMKMEKETPKTGLSMNDLMGFGAGDKK